MKYIIGTLLLLGSVFLIYGQSLRLSFSLIDDGQIILKKRQIVDIVKSGHVTELNNILFEPDVGRVRPVYWWAQSTFAYLGHESPVALHGIRIFLLLVTLALIYRLLRNLKVSSNISFISLFLFLVNFQNAENYLRLGPTEPLLALVLIIILNIFVKNPFSKLITCLSLFFLPLIGIGIKETFIANAVLYIPFTIFINKKLKLSGILATLSSLIGLICVFLIKKTYPVADAYSSQYVFNITSTISSLFGYIRLIWDYQKTELLALIVFLLAFRKYKSNYLFLLGFLTNLAILLPWKYTLNRYLLPTNIFLVIIFANTYNLVIYKTLSKFNSKTSLIFINIIIISLAICLNVFETANYQYFQQNDSLFTGTLLSSLNKHLPYSSELVSNYMKGDNNIEIYVETLWHLQLFYSRWDIKYGYLDGSNLCTDQNRFVLDRRSDRYLPKEQLNQSLELVASYSGNLKVINGNKYIKNILMPKLEQTWDKNSVFDWSIYKQNKNTCITQL